MNPRRIYNPVQKDAVTFLQTAKESGGRQTYCRMEVAPGGQVLPHYHQTYTETFVVRSGILDVSIGTLQLILKEGDSATVPRGTLHRWTNSQSQTTLVDVIIEPGHTGFEKTLQAAYGLASDNQVRADGTPKNIFYLALLVAMADMKLSGLKGRLGGLLRLLARIACWLGKDKDLEKYYLDFQQENKAMKV